MKRIPSKKQTEIKRRVLSLFAAMIALAGISLCENARAQIYVATADNGAADNVFAYNADGSSFGGFTTITGNNPYGVALDGVGNLYVGNLNGPNILKYNAATGCAAERMTFFYSRGFDKIL